MRETLNARIEVNLSSDRDNIQQYLEQRSTTLGKERQRRTQQTHDEFVFDINYAECTNPRKCKLITISESISIQRRDFFT